MHALCELLAVLLGAPAVSYSRLLHRAQFSGKLLGFSPHGLPGRAAYSIRGPVHLSTVYNPPGGLFDLVTLQKSTNALILI